MTWNVIGQNPQLLLSTTPGYVSAEAMLPVDHPQTVTEHTGVLGQTRALETWDFSEGPPELRSLR